MTPSRSWVQDLTPEDASVVSTGVIAFGRSQAPGGHAQEISCGLYADDRLLAGAVGRTEFRRLFISYLWVEESMRGQGIGSDVLRRLEAQALKRGCIDALIETLSDRNAELYERLGYAMMAHMHDYIPGFTRYILIKVWKPRD